MSKLAIFSIGQLVDHKLFGYRGVVFDIDPEFMLSDEWYDTVAKSRPPKDEPWYHVLVDNASHTTYVAEQNLCESTDYQQINHPLLGTYFKSYIDNQYVARKASS